MFKRHRWLKNEDEELRAFYTLQKDNEKINWETISLQMQRKNILKTGKQCKERWKNQINPSLYKKKKKWTLGENKLLFDLHRKNGNRWTIISGNFEGRSVNCVKNNFFKLMKKSLRNSIKYSNVIKSPFFINSLKPKILGNFLKSKFTVKIPVFDENRIIKGYRKKEIFISPFLEKFYFLKVTDKICKDDKYVVEKVVNLIEEMNIKYIEKSNFRKKKRIEKRKKFEEFRKKNRSTNQIAGLSNGFLKNGDLVNFNKKSEIVKDKIIEKSEEKNEKTDEFSEKNKKQILSEQLKNHDLGKITNKNFNPKKSFYEKPTKIVTEPEPYYMIFQNKNEISQDFGENHNLKKSINREKNGCFEGIFLKKNNFNDFLERKNGF